jgi:hypothetical protein
MSTIFEEAETVGQPPVEASHNIRVYIPYIQLFAVSPPFKYIAKGSTTTAACCVSFSGDPVLDDDP